MSTYDATEYQERYQERKEESLCVVCGAPAADDSSMCERHRDANRVKAANSLARLREERRERGVCPYCPAGVETKLSGDERMCAACRVSRHRTKSLEAVVNRVVNRAARIAARTVVDATGRTRYHGRERRGQQTHAELNAEDLEMADESYRAFRAGVEELGKPETKTWPRGEIDRLRAVTAHEGQRVSDSIDPILERLGHFKQRHGRRDGE